MTYLAFVSAFLMALGWAMGQSVGYPNTGLGCGIAAVAAILIFLGGDE